MSIDMTQAKLDALAECQDPAASDPGIPHRAAQRFPARFPVLRSAHHGSRLRPPRARSLARAARARRSPSVTCRIVYSTGFVKNRETPRILSSKSWRSHGC